MSSGPEPQVLVGDLAVQRWPRGAVWAGGAVYCLVMGQFGSFTWESDVGLLVAWVAVLWAGLVQHRPRIPAPRRLAWTGIGAWAVPILGFSALELVNDHLGSTPAHPTLSVLMDPVLESPVNRTVAVAVWLLAGWELVRR